MKQILITGELIAATQMEVIDSNSGKTQVCLANSHTYPFEVWFSGGALINKTIIVCGGKNDNSFPDRTTACYSFDGIHPWKKFGDMSSKKNPALIPFDHGVWITGGFITEVGSTDILYLNGTKTPGPQIQSATTHHCVVKYKTFIFLVGGLKPKENYRDEFYFFFSF